MFLKENTSDERVVLNNKTSRIRIFHDFESLRQNFEPRLRSLSGSLNKDHGTERMMGYGESVDLGRLPRVRLRLLKANPTHVECSHSRRSRNGALGQGNVTV